MLTHDHEWEWITKELLEKAILSATECFPLADRLVSITRESPVFSQALVTCVQHALKNHGEDLPKMVAHLAQTSFLGGIAMGIQIATQRMEKTDA
jgi:hypothetical protein